MIRRPRFSWLSLVLPAAMLAAGCGQSGSGDSTGPSSVGSGLISSAWAQEVGSTAASVPSIPDPKQVEQVILSAGSAVAQGGGGTFAQNAAKSAGGTATKALLSGWNFIVPSYCMGTYIGGTYFVYVVGRDGSITWTSDPAAIAMISPGCAYGSGIGFYVTYSTNSGNFYWSNVAIYHP